MPGAFVVHFDGHVSQLGTFGTLAMGIRRNILEAFVRERISIKVPHTVRVNLRGTLQQGRDGARRVPPPRAHHGPILLPLPGPGDRRPGAVADLDGGPADHHGPRHVHRRHHRHRQPRRGTARLCAAARQEEARARLQRSRMPNTPPSTTSTSTTSSRSSSFRRRRPIPATCPSSSGSRSMPAISAPAPPAAWRICAIAAKVLEGPPGEAGLPAQRRARRARRSWRGRAGGTDRRPWSRPAPSSRRRAATIASAASPP